MDAALAAEVERPIDWRRSRRSSTSRRACSARLFSERSFWDWRPDQSLEARGEDGAEYDGVAEYEGVEE